MSGGAAKCALAVAVALATPAAARAEAIALTGATIHTVSGPVLEHATVVIQDGKIAAVGADAPVPAGATVVPCEGKHVYPGFIDANSVLGLVEIGSVRGTVDETETGDVNPNIRAEVQINPDSELIPVARLNGVTSALVIPRGGALNGSSGLIHLDGWTYEDMTIAAPVALHIQWPNMTPVRGAWWMTQSEEEQNRRRDEAIQRIRDAFDDARAYRKALAAEGQAGIPRHDRDVRWDAMIRALDGEIPVMIHAARLNQIRAALRFADEQGLGRIVLVGGGDADRMLDELKERKIAVIAGPILTLPNRSWEPYDQPMSLPRRLAAAGIPFCISNGGGENSSSNGRNLPYHAAMAASFGLPRDHALRSITLDAARILGVADRLGSIEPGKIADLVVASGDPLEITTRIEQVYVAGRPVAMETRQTRLFQKYDQRPRPVRTVTQTPGQGAATGNRAGGGRR
jgi:imidazolonepropionase-like amidohydrolase